MHVKELHEDCVIYIFEEPDWLMNEGKPKLFNIRNEDHYSQIVSEEFSLAYVAPTIILLSDFYSICLDTHLLEFS